MTSSFLKRLRYLSWHRGTKENDILLGLFSDAYLDTFSKKELNTYQNLLEENDQDIYQWIMSDKNLDSLDSYANLILKIRQFHKKNA